MNPQEAADLALAIRGLVAIAIMGFASGLIFAALFGTVNPRLRRSFRRIRARDAIIAGLKREHAALTEQNESLTRQAHANEKALFDAQQQTGKLELEVRRQTRIREKTEDALINYRKEVGR